MALYAPNEPDHRSSVILPGRHDPAECFRFAKRRIVARSIFRNYSIAKAYQ
jgi:hypothetical protein